MIAQDHGAAVVEGVHGGSQYLACVCLGCSKVEVDVDAVGANDLKFGEGAGSRVRDADPVQQAGAPVQAGQVPVAPRPCLGFQPSVVSSSAAMLDFPELDVPLRKMTKPSLPAGVPSACCRPDAIKIRLAGRLC
ncbi:hypothetical protein ABIA32_006045 [Streptacidiphilus sp. MAP12-20]